MRALMLLLLAACTAEPAADTADPEPDRADLALDVDGDGWTVADGDCDDSDASVHPGATETCDGDDEDCDGEVDEDAVDARTWYADADGDGWGDDAVAIRACLAPAGAVSRAGDCDDSDPDFHPGAPEDDCTDPNDYNCDGSVGWADEDGDGWAACEDCDDSDPALHPGAAETCDGRDEDCDGDMDELAVDAGTWYADEDGDGWGAPEDPVVSCEAPEGRVSRAGDCDDGDASVHPGAAEVCDAADADEDCDGLADDDDPDASGRVRWYADADGDGWGDAATGGEACDPPAGSVAVAGDCDDANASVHPGAAEVCDEHDTDEDCDGLADDSDPDVTGTTAWYRDLDGDGYGNPLVRRDTCDAPSGYVADDTDCDDTDASVHPGAAEVCDGGATDEDCDGLVDDDDPDLDTSSASSWYEDADGDGYAGTEVLACRRPPGASAAASDCDDSDASVHPGATEVCDAADVDEDCDGLADDDDPDLDATTASTWYADADGDGWGDASSTVVACDAPSGFVADGTDCDDSDASVHPGATEVCDAADADEDCDGLADDDDPDVDLSTGATFHPDADGDGWGDASSATVACDAPSGFVADGTDCDDSDASVHPGATEVCDAADVDEDCDGLADDDDPSADPATMTTVYADLDGDGYGDPAAPYSACDPGSAWVSDATDCDDSDASVHPGATEDCATAADDDCDGDTNDEGATSCTDYYADADGDGHGAGTAACLCTAADPYTATVADDCDDDDPDVHPGATEVCDAVDDDCDGLVDEDDPDAVLDTWYADADGDGYGDASAATGSCEAPSGTVADDTDCDDDDPDVHPGATERYGDAVDDDCDGETVPVTECTGVSVPGDYATLADAVSALEGSGTLTTICLGSGTFSGTTIGADLEIVGVSTEDTVISGTVTVKAASTSTHEAETVLRSIRFEDGIVVDDTSYWTNTVEILDSVVENPSGHAILVKRDGYGNPYVVIDGVDASTGTTTGSAVHVSDTGSVSSDPLVVVVRNSYLHDSACGVCASTSSSKYPDTEVYVYHSTILDNVDGIRLSATRGDTVWEVANTLVAGSSDTALDISSGRSTTWSTEANAFWDNATRFGGEARAAADDVTDDPELDDSFAPPRPSSSSPLVGAGASLGVTEDFWGDARPDPPTIGCVEP